MGGNGRAVRQHSQMMGNRDFLKRIEKSLYYGKLPSIPCLSLPVMELSTDVFSEAQKGKSLKRLYVDDAAELTRNACVSPCSLVLALLYLERLKTYNPDYVADIAPAELFLVSLMVSNKFLQDDGEEDEVFADEWATSAGITSMALNTIERKFLHAIDWRVFVDEVRFESMLEWLEQQIALRQAKLRGWFTYTDLANINNVVESIGLLKCLMTVYMALSISYFASVYTLVASSFIVSQSLMTLTASSNLSHVFDCTRYSNPIETTYVHHNNGYVLPQNFIVHSTDTTYEANNLRFLTDNDKYIKEELTNEFASIGPKVNVDYFKPLYVLFVREILEPISNKCGNISDINESYESRIDRYVENDLKRISSIQHDNCIANIHFWSKPMVC